MQKKREARQTIGRAFCLPALLAIAVLLAGACAGSGDGTGTSSPEATETPTAAALADLTPVDAAVIYEAVSPSVPLVRSAAGASAGLLVEGGLVLTAADIVTGAGSITVAFTDGAVVTDVPVLAVDVSTDIATLGPVETDIVPSPLVDPDTVAVGTELFIVGYGAAGEMPAIGRVLLASAFDWKLGGLRFLQLDDSGIALRGMAVVLDRSGRALALQVPGRAGPLALAATVVNGRAAVLTEDATAGGRLLAGGVVSPVQTIKLGPNNSQGLLAFDAPAGSPTTLVLSGDAAVALTVFDATGASLEEALSIAGEQLAVTLDPGPGGPRFALVQLQDPEAAGEGATIEASADVDLSLFTDPDDGVVLAPGDVLEGSLDFPGDLDVVLVDMVAGQSVTVQASSPRVDPLLELRPLGEDAGLVDDDSGGGPFASDALVQLKAATAGTHVIVVSDALLSATGGYALAVIGAESDVQLSETIDQIRGLAGSVMSDPRGEEALRELLSGMMASEEPALPAAFGAAWRGTIGPAGPVTNVATTDTTAGEGSARIVEDADGRFSVRATILARGQAAALPLVTDVTGAAVATGANGQLEVGCPSTLACTATIMLDVVDAAGLGPWTVSLTPVAGEIEAWQIEVLANGAPEGASSLPPGQ